MFGYFRSFFVTGVVLYAMHFPVLADRTHVLSHVFEDHLGGQKALNPARATNASLAHINGIKGRTKAGQRLLAAVIDCSINANLPHMKKLKREGLIHSAALSSNNPYLMNPEEELDKYDLIKDKLSDELQNRIAMWNAYNEPSSGAHGAGVIHALHQIAPEASILPIDITVMGLFNKKLTYSQTLTQGIRAAIDHGADIINVSRTLDDFDQESFEAMAEAVRKGIILVIAAGNYSFDLVPIYIRQFWDEIKNEFVTSKEQELFDKLKGKGIIFAGSTGIDPLGEEKVSKSSQHPDDDTGKNFVLAPGENLNIQANNDPKKLLKGTSFSAPVVAGALLDLKQHCVDKGYFATSDDLINVLYESGHDIVYKGTWPFTDKTYKSVDVLKACQLADERFQSKKAPFGMKPIAPVMPSQKPAPIVIKSPIPVKPVSIAPVMPSQKPAPIVIKSPIPVKPVSIAPVMPSQKPASIVVKSPVAPVNPTPKLTQVLTKSPIPAKPVSKAKVPVKLAVQKAPVKAVSKKSVISQRVAKKAPPKVVAKKPVVNKRVAKKAPPKVVAKKPVVSKRVAKKAPPKEDYCVIHKISS